MPMVAMTASDALDDAAKWRAAGIDECLTKPIDLGILSDLVERWTRIKQAASPSEPDSAPEGSAGNESRAASGVTRRFGSAEAPGSEQGPQTPVPNVIDLADSLFQTTAQSDPATELAALNPKQLEESSMGMPSLREALLKTFLGDVERRFERLSQLVTDADAQGIEFEAHGLRGMAATIGAEGCMAAFAELEQLGADRRVRGPAVKPRWTAPGGRSRTRRGTRPPRFSGDARLRRYEHLQPAAGRPHQFSSDIPQFVLRQRHGAVPITVRDLEANAREMLTGRP
jgi:HPt (histidine-containing phosphotransfer) domain-containing protein